jgi:hypothetical protein
MTSINLKAQYIKDISDDPILRGHIEKAVKRSNATVQRWAEDNNDMLGHISVLKTIATYKGLSIEELIEVYAEELAEQSTN